MDALKDWLPFLCQVGLMIWWMSKTNADLASIKETLRSHIEDDEEMRKQIQALEVQEANVGGTLANVAMQIDYIRKNLEQHDDDSGEILQLKLNAQSHELTLRFRDMLHTAKREIGDETASAIAFHIKEALHGKRLE